MVGKLPFIFAYFALAAVFVAFRVVYILHFVRYLFIGCVTVFALVPVPLGVTAPFFRKVVGKLRYLFRFSCAAGFAGKGLFALLRTGCGLRNLAVVPVVLGLVHLLGAVFVRGALVPVVRFIAAPFCCRNVAVVI